MRPLRDIPIRSKLRLMVIAVSGLAVVIAGSVFVWSALLYSKAENARELRSLGDMVANSMSVAVIPGANSAGDDSNGTLSLLRFNANVIAGAVYTFPENAPITQYLRENSGSRLPKTLPQPGFHPPTLEYVGLIHDPSSKKRVGTVYIRGDLERQNRFIRNCLIIVFAAIATAALIAMLLAFKAERLITQPIYSLLQITQRSTRQKDYSLRANATAHDEVAELVEGFNNLLRQIEEQDGELLAHRENLEAIVEQSTAELRQANDELVKAKDSADIANHAKSSFLANMSHELRTPLNAVIGYSEMIEEELIDNSQESLLPDIRRINQAGKHLLTLINDILDLSKIEAGRMHLFPEAFDLAQLADDVIDMIDPLAIRNGNVLEMETTEESMPVHTDQVKVRQILYNLLSNACKFTHEGLITLGIRLEQQGTQAVAIITVEDSGVGMTAKQIDRIFDSFTQAESSTAKKFGGTGLGLAISKKYCEMMGGSLTVQSKPGQGTTFTATIAAHLPPSRTTTVRVKTRAGTSRRTTRSKGSSPLVLVVDDDEAARDLVSRQLLKEGYRVQTASNGADGLLLSREIKPDVITLDIFMPGMTGWDFIRRFKSDPELLDIPIIIVSMLEEKHSGLALGATDFLVKPVDPTELLSVIRKNCPSPETPAVLLVEDNIDFRMLMERSLVKEQFRVDTAGNGREALARLNERRPDIILLDLLMPEMNGFEFIDELQRRPEFHGIPIIVVTAKDLTEEDQHQLRGFVSNIVPKQTGPSGDWPGRLIEQVAKLTNHHRPNGEPGEDDSAAAPSGT